MLSIVMGSNGNRTRNENDARTTSELSDSSDVLKLDRTRLVDALAELQKLLEEYAPSWYTEEHHAKAKSALHPLKKR
jgi:hypothetical protein